MKEIDVTDQRPKTTTAQMPEGMRALKPIEKDPELVAFVEKLKRDFAKRVTEDK